MKNDIINAAILAMAFVATIALAKIAFFGIKVSGPSEVRIGGGYITTYTRK